MYECYKCYTCSYGTKILWNWVQMLILEKHEMFQSHLLWYSLAVNFRSTKKTLVAFWADRKLQYSAIALFPELY